MTHFSVCEVEVSNEIIKVNFELSDKAALNQSRQQNKQHAPTPKLSDKG